MRDREQVAVLPFSGCRWLARMLAKQVWMELLNSEEGTYGRNALA